jgi:tetratricopeptide (TPR) repeat protein
MTGSRTDPNPALAEAWRRHQAGDAGEAERLCRAALADDPNSHAAMNLLAILLEHQGALGEAESWVRKALQRSPRDPALLNTLGNLLVKRGDPVRAKASYEQSVALHPGQHQAHYNLGLVLRQLGDAAAALAALERAAELKPDYAEALTEIAALLREQRRHEESLQRLDQALAASPRHFPALYYRGLVLLGLDRYEEALAQLEEAVALRPQSPEAQHALGNALGYCAREAEALAAYQKAIEAAPGYVNAHLDYNALAWTLGLHKAQWQSYAYARHRLGDAPDLLLAEAEQRLRVSDAASAETLLRRANQLAPGRASLENALGRALTARGSFDEAVALFRRAAGREPGESGHLREWAGALLHGRKAADAIPVLEKARAADPANQFLLGLTTLAYRETGDPRYAALTGMEGYVRSYRLSPPPGFADMDGFHRALAEALMTLHTGRVAPHDQTLRGGTQTPGNLFARGSRPVLLLKDLIEEAVADYVARMPDDPAHPLFGRKQERFRFSGSWSCRLGSSGFHTNHLHPQGWISSAYYVGVPDAVGDGRQGWLKFGESNLNLGERDRPENMIRPEPGLLVLFPSYFWHGTVPFQSDQARLTVAFDAVPQTIG